MKRFVANLLMMYRVHAGTTGVVWCCKKVQILKKAYECAVHEYFELVYADCRDGTGCSGFQWLCGRNGFLHSDSQCRLRVWSFAIFTGPCCTRNLYLWPGHHRGLSERNNLHAHLHFHVDSPIPLSHCVLYQKFSVNNVLSPQRW